MTKSALIRGPLVPRWIIRRLYAPFQPDIEQERRVRNYLYGPRTQVEVVRKFPFPSKATTKSEWRRP